METSKRHCKDKVIYKFSPVNQSRLSIFWVSNSSKCCWQLGLSPQTPFGGLRTPPSPQFHWQEIIWMATATQINFLDQPMSICWEIWTVNANTTMQQKAYMTLSENNTKTAKTSSDHSCVKAMFTEAYK